MRRARFPEDMFKVVLAQCAAALIGVLLAAALFGKQGVLSAAIGGVACVVPSLIFAWRLSRKTVQPAITYVGTFFFGEVAKLALALGILIAVSRLYPGLHWGALLTGMAVTLQANLLAFLIRT